MTRRERGLIFFHQDIFLCVSFFIFFYECSFVNDGFPKPFLAKVSCVNQIEIHFLDNTWLKDWKSEIRDFPFFSFQKWDMIQGKHQVPYKRNCPNFAERDVEKEDWFFFHYNIFLCLFLHPFLRMFFCKRWFSETFFCEGVMCQSKWDTFSW